MNIYVAVAVSLLHLLQPFVCLCRRGPSCSGEGRRRRIWHRLSRICPVRPGRLCSVVAGWGRRRLGSVVAALARRLARVPAPGSSWGEGSGSGGGLLSLCGEVAGCYGLARCVPREGNASGESFHAGADGGQSIYVTC